MNPGLAITWTMCCLLLTLMHINALRCRRECAIRESCKACQAFKHSIWHSQVCSLYLNNLCDYDQVSMFYDITVGEGFIWEKVSGDNINNAMTCYSDTNCSISTAIPTMNETSPTLSYSQNIVTDNQTTNTTKVTNAFANTSIMQTTTSSSASSALMSTIQTTTQKPVQTKPRTCWDYYAYNRTNDTVVPIARLIWPTGFSNGTSITVYCRNGYTIIFSNYAALEFANLHWVYDNKNEVTVFGSTSQRIATTNTTGWKAYVSNVDFPTLSTLVRISNRTLYYEQALDFVDAVGTYSGLDIAPDGTLTVQGNLHMVRGSPSNGFLTPLINSPFVSSTCGSFWKIPTTSTDICNQTTNILLLAENQKVGGDDRRFITLAFT